jgi:hypothetical protein
MMCVRPISYENVALPSDFDSQLSLDEPISRITSGRYVLYLLFEKEHTVHFRVARFSHIVCRILI